MHSSDLFDIFFPLLKPQQGFDVKTTHISKTLCMFLIVGWKRHGPARGGSTACISWTSKKAGPPPPPFMEKLRPRSQREKVHQRKYQLEKCCPSHVGDAFREPGAQRPKMPQQNSYCLERTIIIVVSAWRSSVSRKRMRRPKGHGAALVCPTFRFDAPSTCLLPPSSSPACFL